MFNADDPTTSLWLFWVIVGLLEVAAFKWKYGEREHPEDRENPEAVALTSLGREEEARKLRKHPPVEPARSFVDHAFRWSQATRTAEDRRKFEARPKWAQALLGVPLFVIFIVGSLVAGLMVFFGGLSLLF